MAKAPVKRRKRKPAKKNFLVLVSSCGSHEQIEFLGAATTQAAAEKTAQKHVEECIACGNDMPRAIFITKIEKTGRSSGDINWA